MKITNNNDRYQIIKKTTYLSAITNIVLSVIKIIFGWLGHSQALIADGIHSFTDLLTDVFVLIAAKAGNQDADEDHPYGHGRIETAATILIGMILGIIGFALGAEAVKRLIDGASNQTPTIPVIIVAVIAIIINYFLYRYLVKVSKNINSPLVLGNANHHKSDIYVSIVVLISVIASRLGWPILDDIATIIIALMIVKMGAVMIYDCIRELIDTAVEPAVLKQITKCVKSTEGVVSIHECRTRTIAGKILLDIHVIVDDSLTVSEGHYIGDRVACRLKQEVEHVTDVIVHIDAEDDEHIATGLLPSRKELMPQLEAACPNNQLWQSVQTIRLHYLDNKISAELYLPLAEATNSTLDDFKENCLDITAIATVKVFFS